MKWAIRFWPWSRFRAYENLLRAHHNVSRVHARCGLMARAEAWGEFCPICTQLMVVPSVESGA